MGQLEHYEAHEFEYPIPVVTPDGEDDVHTFRFKSWAESFEAAQLCGAICITAIVRGKLHKDR